MAARNPDNRFGHRGIHGTELVHGPLARTFVQGRVCSMEGCGTKLSRYNPNARCWIHSNT
jgi:hypothetical protein